MNSGPNIRAERLKYVAAVFLYGTIGLFVRYTALPVGLVAMCRGIIGSLVIRLWLAARKKKPDRTAIRRNLPWLAAAGICLGLNWVFLFAAYMKTTVVVATMCYYMGPVIVILAAPLMLRERLAVRKLPCAAAALAGMFLISGAPAGAPENPAGVLLGLAAALFFALVVLCNRKLRDISAPDRTLVQLQFSAVTLLPYVLAFESGEALNAGIRSVPPVLVLGVIHTGVAYCLYFSGMAALPVQTVAVLGYLDPVVSVLCSTLLLREALPLQGWIGAGLVLAASLLNETVAVKRSSES